MPVALLFLALTLVGSTALVPIESGWRIALLVAGGLAGTVGYLRAETDTASPARTWAIAVSLTATAALIPVDLSPRLADDLARGRVESAHRANPYLLPPAQFGEDPFVRAASDRSLGNPRGPLTSAWFTGFTATSGDDPRVTTRLYKLIAAISHLLIGFLIHAAHRGRGPSAAAARAARWLHHPGVLIVGVSMAHSAWLPMLPVALALRATRSGHHGRALAALGFAALLEPQLTPIAIPALGLALRRRRWWATALGVAVPSVVAYLLFRHYASDPAALDTILADPAAARGSFVHWLEAITSTDGITVRGWCSGVAIVVATILAAFTRTATDLFRNTIRVAALAALCLPAPDPAQAGWALAIGTMVHHRALATLLAILGIGAWLAPFVLAPWTCAIAAATAWWPWPATARVHEGSTNRTGD